MITGQKNELWVQVNGFEKRYFISNHGRVKSLPKWVKNRYNGYMTREKILSPKKNNKGYFAYELRDGLGNSKMLKRSRLVASHFIPNPNNKDQVNHIDGDRSNDYFENLEWVTQSENIKHSYDHLGRKAAYKGKFGKDHNQSKQIKATLDNTKLVFENLSRCAEKFGVSIQAVSMALRGINKTCKGYKIELNKC